MSATTYGSDLEVTHERRDEEPDSVARRFATRSGDTPGVGPYICRRHASTGSAAAPVLDLARPTFTITEAATACSMSRKTITRKLPELASNGAAKDQDGVWRIPWRHSWRWVCTQAGRCHHLPVASPRPAAPPVAPAPGDRGRDRHHPA